MAEGTRRHILYCFCIFNYLYEQQYKRIFLLTVVAVVILSIKLENIKLFRQKTATFPKQVGTVEKIK
jgi:hypothetical protein